MSSFWKVLEKLLKYVIGKKSPSKGKQWFLDNCTCRLQMWVMWKENIELKKKIKYFKALTINKYLYFCHGF